MVVCASGSSASGVAVVVAYLFGCVGGEERAAGNPGVDWQWRLPDRVLEVRLDDSGRSVVLGCGAKVFRVKDQRFGANGGDACGCRDPLGGAGVVIFPTSELRVKTLDRLGLDDGGAVRRHPLGGPPAAVAPLQPSGTLPLVPCPCCRFRNTICRVSQSSSNPGRVYYKCPNHRV